MNRYVNEKKFFEFFNNEIDADLLLLFRLQAHFYTHIEEFENCKSAPNKEKLEDIYQSAHKLKSSCSSFGALEMANLLQNLEDVAKQNEAELAMESYRICLEAIRATKMELEQIVEDIKRSV